MPSPPVALVTGANRGIGLAIAEALAREDHRVLLGSRRLEAGERAASRLRRRGLDVTALSLDMTSLASIDGAVAQLRAMSLVPTVLVNNAGILHGGRLLAMPDARIAESFAVHVLGPLHLIRALLPGMRARRRGRIVNVSSGWGSFSAGLEGPGAYGLTKATLNALTLRLSRELPDVIKINAMDPGWVRTRMGGTAAPRTPQQAAATALWLATLPADGPTGGFFHDKASTGW